MHLQSSREQSWPKVSCPSKANSAAGGGLFGSTCNIGADAPSSTEFCKMFAFYTILTWLHETKQWSVHNDVYSLSDTCWERSYYSNPGLTWKHMLTVLFVKALQAPQGTCIETLHTCWCIFWWCSWHFSCRTQEEVGRAARPAQKLAPQGVVQGTWMSSKSKEMIAKNHNYQHGPQTGRQQNKKLWIL